MPMISTLIPCFCWNFLIARQHITLTRKIGWNSSEPSILRCERSTTKAHKNNLTSAPSWIIYKIYQILNVTFIFNVTPCSPEKICRRFREKYCPIFRVEYEIIYSSEKPLFFYQTARNHAVKDCNRHTHRSSNIKYKELNSAVRRSQRPWEGKYLSENSFVRWTKAEFNTEGNWLWRIINHE
jgi:hypothetical protein